MDEDKHVNDLKGLFAKAVDNNYAKLKPYLCHRPYWIEVREIKTDICKDLLTDSHIAAICTTNHFLERILKLALTYKDIQGQTITDATNNTAFATASQKYDSKDLSDTINACCTQGLITKQRKLLLQDLRDRIRNGFSHASMHKVFGADKHTVFKQSAGNPDLLQAHEVDIVNVPFIQGIALSKFARDNAMDYFKVVYDTLIMIEKEIAQKSL